MTICAASQVAPDARYVTFIRSHAARAMAITRMMTIVTQLFLVVLALTVS